MAETCKHCGAVDNWHHGLTECVTRLRSALDAQHQLNLSFVEQNNKLIRLNLEATARAEAAERDRDDYRDGAAAEARRCDELLAERNRARNETLAALEKLEAAEKRLADVETLDAHGDWGMRPGPRQVGPESFCDTWPNGPDGRVFAGSTPPEARAATAQWVREQQKAGGGG